VQVRTADSRKHQDEEQKGNRQKGCDSAYLLRLSD